MTIKELIKILETYPPDSKVYFTKLPNGEVGMVIDLRDLNKEPEGGVLSF